jgi:hypothetical protein
MVRESAPFGGEYIYGFRETELWVTSLRKYAF